MKPQHLTALLAIADHGLVAPVQLTTQALAKQLGLSQQAASRLLSELEQEKCISRESGITITTKGKAVLESLRDRLNSAFQQKPKQFSGEVKTGLGEGAYYMKMDGYKRQFERKLGFVPYAGTLNLTVTKEIGNAVYDDPTFFTIEGFSAAGRTFGGLRAKRCVIAVGSQKVDGAVIIPDRTSHGAETIEVIAKVNLRKALGLREGGKARVEY